MLIHRYLHVFRDTFLLSVTLLSLSLVFFKIGGYSVSVAFIFNLYFLVSKPLLRSHLYIYFFFLLFFLFNLIYQIWALDIVEFIKTCTLFSFAILTFLNYKRVSLKNWSEASLKNTVKFCVLITVGIALLQVSEFLFLNSTNYYKIFDGISISTAESADRFQAVNLLSFIRPISVYHEPSYYGSVLLLLFMCANALRMHFIWKFLTFFGIILSLSMTVYFFTILYIGYLLRDYKYILAILLIVGFVFFAGPELLITLRIDEIIREGTSGNQRVVAPIYSIIFEFSKVYTIFGRSLGQMEKQLDNSFFVLFGYFGVFFPLLLYFIWCYIKISLKKSTDQVVFIIFFLNVLFLNGAIITPESQFMLFLLFLVLHSVSSRERLESI